MSEGITSARNFFWADEDPMWDFGIPMLRPSSFLRIIYLRVNVWL